MPVLEDKIVQRATVEVLNAIYEVDFLGFEVRRWGVLLVCIESDFEEVAMPLSGRRQPAEAPAINSL